MLDSSEESKLLPESMASFFQSANPDAEVFPCVKAQVDLTKLLNLKAFDPMRTLRNLQKEKNFSQNFDPMTHVSKNLDRVECPEISPAANAANAASEEAPSAAKEPSAVREPSAAKAPSAAKVHGLVESFLVSEFKASAGGSDASEGSGGQRPCLLDETKVEAFIGHLLWGQLEGGEGSLKPEYLRMKGIFLGSHKQVCALQAVGETFEVTDLENQAAAKSVFAAPKFLFIGVNLERDRLQRGLEGCRL